ncbi:MAG: hypothetical protein AB1714_07050 [Acidobacteriota bacterium]
MSVPSRGLRLTVNADDRFLQVATSFVEKASLALGLDERAALDLTLASEEIFTYVCHKASPGALISLASRGGGYYVEVDFGFEAREFNMQAFNLTSRVARRADESLEETGLVIASRMVDRFHFSQDGRRLRITLVKERSYPAVEALPLPESKPLSMFAIREPDPEEVKLCVRLVLRDYPPQAIPFSFRSPGKIADMVSCGELRAAIAVDRGGSVGGGIVWRWRGSKLVQSFGPYLFAQTIESGVGKALVDACLTSIARTPAIGIISHSLASDLAAGFFEPLGTVTIRLKDGRVHENALYYRHLEEDLGLAVWSDPAIEPFLRREYERLAFAREIRTVRDDGEAAAYAVLSAGLDREAARATLHPIWWGRDSRETLAAHVNMLQKEGLPNIYFEMDIGRAWHCHFAPALMECGFEPRLLLPYAGEGDLVVFQHRGG